MYYLDFFSRYKRTTLKERLAVRRELTNRNEIMALKLKRQHNLCFYCGVEIDMAGNLEHIIPVYYGGLNKSSNLVASCWQCNNTKSTGQIEITNPWTINDYLKLQEAMEKWQKKVAENPKRKRYPQPRRVQLYGIYRADLFKKV